MLACKLNTYWVLRTQQASTHALYAYICTLEKVEFFVDYGSLEQSTQEASGESTSYYLYQQT